ncbi:hypothetical protein AAU61_09250 [Desulfocarbo indianensis]|nr:hypothetical protein AAU61_09250 [Desulfocarbo indianensis]
MATLSGSIILVLVFLYLHCKERQPGLGLWTAAWGLYCLRFVFEIGLGWWPGALAASVGVQLSALGSAFLLLWGSHALVGARMSPFWALLTALVAIAASLAIYLKLSFMWTALPCFIFQGLAYGRSGVLWLRQKELTGLPARITGVAFVIWGLHKLNYPFLRGLTWAAPWGFLLGAALEVIVALGALLAHFEKAKRQLSESEARYRLLVENASEGVAVFQNGKTKLFNEKMLEITGYAEDELAALDFKETIHPADRRMVVERHQTRMSGRPTPESYEFRILDKSGRLKWLQINVVLIQWERKPAALSLLSDVTGRKEMERALAESEERFRQIAEGIREVFWLVDTDWQTIHYVSPAYEEVWQRPVETLYQKPLSWMESLPAQDRQAVMDYFDGLQKDELTAGIFPQYRVRRGDGSVRWIEARYFPVRNHEGRIYRVAGIAEDITERKQAQAELLTAHQRNQSLLESISDGFFSMDRDHRITYFNKAAEQLLARKAEEVIGRDFFQVFPGTRRSLFAQKCLQALRRRASQQFEARFPDDSPEHWYGVRAFPSAEGVSIYFQKLTEAKRSQMQLDHFFNISPEILCIANFAGHFLRINPSMPKALGCGATELLARPFLELVHPEDREDTRQRMAQLAMGEPVFNFVNRYRAKEGNYRWLSWVAVSSKEEELIYAVARDVTEQINAERERANLEMQLRQAQKMEALGVLAGGIAHDFNNILAAIVGYAELALEAARRRGQDTQDMAQIIRSAQRARDLVRQILTFSRKVEHNFQPLDLNAEILDAVAVLHRTLPKMIDIRTNLAEDLPPVRADSNQVGQVLINLASNAADAMPGGGQLYFGTALISARERTCQACGAVFSGDYIQLTVVDTGQGIDQKTMEHIFDPFFTTKEVGKGTGLGLSMVYGIVKDHRGHIQCHSRPGWGTTFNIFFPLDHREQPAAATLEQAFKPAQCQETVLLVDDEESLRELGKRILSMAGYKVLKASSGEEALRALESRPGEVDLVVLDLNMPGMGGRKCLREILKRNPEAKVVIASGYLAGDQTKDALAEGAAKFVAKPYRAGELLSAIRSALDQGDGG